MDRTALLHEVQNLVSISERLNALAETHPLVSEALSILSGNVRQAATLLEVLIVTKIDPLSGTRLANA
jgi:hypothetical protein